MNDLEKLTAAIADLANEVYELKQLLKCDFTNHNIATALTSIANVIDDSNKLKEKK